jgi:glucose/arabinose dehydrogenase
MRLRDRIVIAGLLLLVTVRVADAQQIRAQLVVQGLSQPLGFVQDPSQPDVQFIVEKGGRIRNLVAGVLFGDFLNLTAQVSNDSEQGLLGLAFAPDYPTSGRFFVNFTRGDGHTVIARFRVSADPLVADPASQFNLVWPGGLTYIPQPYTNHNGGNLQFGPDGYLYIALGDGGNGDDPEHRAQNPQSLLGKVLRLNVNVSDADPQGYDVPANNPFVGNPAVLPEIWAFGLRNPWRYTFDDPLRGGTGALLVADVGQSLYEELNYEPAGVGGRNYGWRNREAAHDNVMDLPPYYLPLRDPIFEYHHSIGGCIVGGYVYRGNNLGASYRGRYFFGDFTSNRIWSLGLSVDGTGEATATSLIDHTAGLGGQAALAPSAWGVDANGEIYVVSYLGRIYRLYLELASNGDFASGMSGWSTFATPDSSYLVTNVVAGVLEFYRQPPPPGQTNQAVVFQSTGIPVGAAMRFQAQFDLANSSTVRKRISVLIHDSNFADLMVCTFWLAPTTPMRTYRVFGHATQAWANATISFYAATPGSDGGAYRLDNVSLRPDFTASDERTDCIDPTAPSPPGGSPGPDLIVNGGFSSGLSPWVLFGQIVSQIAGGVFEFYRSGTAPAGVVLQQTGTGMTSQSIMFATFQLGNSSGVRKRVTVLLHDSNFSDLTACTFWIAPGQPLQTFSVRGFATQSWANATMSFYPSTDDTAQWLRLDDVTLQRTPGTAVLGTECVEPPSPVASMPAVGSRVK